MEPTQLLILSWQGYCVVIKRYGASRGWCCLDGLSTLSLCRSLLSFLYPPLFAIILPLLHVLEILGNKYFLFFSCIFHIADYVLFFQIAIYNNTSKDLSLLYIFRDQLITSLVILTSWSEEYLGDFEFIISEINAKE